MARRKLGKTGIEVSDLGVGTWGLSGDGYGPVSDAEQDRVLDRARALGIRLFETADIYGHGAMEERIGRRLGQVDGLVFVTKIGTDRDADPPRKRFDPEFLTSSLEKSLERLGRVDVALLHNPSAQVFESAEASDLLEGWVQDEKIRAWGVSAGSEEVGRAAIGRGAQVVELAFNAFHITPLRDLSDAITESEVGVLARSVLSYGLLCGHWPPHKTFPTGDHRLDRWTPDELRRRVGQLDALRSIVGGPVLTMRAAALRYVLSNELVSSAVLGPRSTVQLDQLVREAGREPPYLSDEKLSKLATRLEDVGVEV